MDLHGKFSYHLLLLLVRFGYKLHLISSTGSLIVPLSADFTQANICDNQIYPAITSSLPQGVRYMTADSGYDNHKLYNLSIDRGVELGMSYIRNIQPYLK